MLFKSMAATKLDGSTRATDLPYSAKVWTNSGSGGDHCNHEDLSIALLPRARGPSSFVDAALFLLDRTGVIGTTTTKPSFDFTGPFPDDDGVTDVPSELR
jgi:hypothetical protein